MSEKIKFHHQMNIGEIYYLDQFLYIITKIESLSISGNKIHYICCGWDFHKKKYYYSLGSCYEFVYEKFYKNGKYILS